MVRSDFFTYIIYRLLLGCTGLGTFGTVFGTTLSAVFHTGGIERTAYDVIAYTGKVLDTTATHQNDAVLLQIVAFAGDIGVDLLTVGEAHTRNFTHCRVRLFRRGGVDTDAYTATLRARIQCGRLALILKRHTSFSY